MMVRIAGAPAPPCATMMPDKSTATEGLGMAAQWEGSVHINMVTALQCAPLTAIMMQENSSATWDMMTMDAGWVTSALQENAQQEHTEDKIIVLTDPKIEMSTSFEDTLLYQYISSKPPLHI